MPETTKVYTVRLPIESWQRLEKLARERGMTRNRFLRALVEHVTRIPE